MSSSKWHGGRSTTSSTWREVDVASPRAVDVVVDVAVVIQVAWGRRPRGVGVADYVDVAWLGSSSSWTWRGVVVVPNPAWLCVSIREGGERWWWSTAAAGAVW
jgi:hypothetical protein